MSLDVIQGAGGGAAATESRAPVEAPNSLHSTELARIVDALSEGPIQGFAHGGSNPLLDVYLNETPVCNSDGSINFDNITVDSRYGEQDQTEMPTFSNVENEIGVGVELRASAPWTQAITDLDTSAIRLRIAMPQAQQTDTSNGNIRGIDVQYKIEVATDGGAYVWVLNSAFIGKTTTEYDRTHRIALPRATVSGWVIKVTRTTANADSTGVADTTTIQSYTEIIDAKLRYPNTALVGIVIDAKQFNAVPSRSYDVFGRIISVPSNYNPTTRAYTGVWNGTFKQAWTDNPVWIFYDLVTHLRYGLGQWVTASRINKWALYPVAQYCDELVPDGQGSTEPRFTCNLYLQAQQDAYKVLADLSSIFRGMAFWAGGAVQAVADMPSDPDFTYTNANVVDGQFSYQGSDLKTRFTVALVSWNDPADFGRAKVAYVPDREGIARYGVRQTSIIAVGCTSPGQAQRAGLWALLTSRIETETVSFSVGQDGTLIAPGRIVRIADARRANSRQGGRIHAATATQVTLDALPTVIPIGGTLTCTLPSGVTETRTITGIADKVITVGAAYSETPLPEAVFVAEGPTLAAATFRIVSIAEPQSSGEDSLTYSLTAVQHNASKFDAVDTGAMVVIPPTVLVQGGTLTAPSVVSVTSYARIGETRAIPVITVGWPRVDGATRYQVRIRRDNGEWSPIHTVLGNHWELDNVLPGDYVASVAAANTQTISAPTLSDTYTLDDSALTPTIIDDLQDAVTAAQADATAALADIANFSQDGVLTPVEKKSLIRDYNVITTEQAGIDAQALAFGTTTQVAAYDGKVSALTTYLGTLNSPTDWNDLSGDTTIVAATFNAAWEDVYTARQTLLNAIYAAAKAKADAAQATADTATGQVTQLPVINGGFATLPAGYGWSADAGTGWVTDTSGGTPGVGPNGAMRVAGTGSNTGAYRNNGRTAVQSGNVMKAQALFKLVGVTGTAFVYISWLSSSLAEIGTTIGNQLIGTTTDGSYVVGVAPTGARYAVVCLGYNAMTAGTVYADNVVCTQHPSNIDEVPDGSTYLRQVQNSSSVSIPNSNFQLPRDSQGNIPGWVETNTLFYLSTSALFGGMQCALLKATAGSGNAGAQCTKQFKVSPGDSIWLGASVASLNGGYLFMRATVYDASGAALTYSQPATSSTAAINVGSTVVAPSTAAYVVITLGLVQPASGSIYAVFSSIDLRINDVRVAGSGATLGNQFNAPNSLTLNYGAVRSATALSATTSGAVSVNAFTYYAGAASVHYNAVSNAVTGLSASSTYYIYCHDSGQTGGTKTWLATTNSATVMQSDDIVVAGYITIPTSGTGSGGGTGGGGLCVEESMWLRRGLRANAARWWHWISCFDMFDGRGKRKARVRGKPKQSTEPCVQIVTDHNAALICSESTPFTDRNGDMVWASQMEGRWVLTDGGWERVAYVRNAGRRRVVHIDVGGLSYAAGENPKHRIYSHNPVK